MKRNLALFVVAGILLFGMTAFAHHSIGRRTDELAQFENQPPYPPCAPSVFARARQRQDSTSLR